MKLDLFDYILPGDKIGTSPATPRESARLLVINRQNLTIDEGQVGDLVSILGLDDVLVLNDTKVFPARLFGQKGSGGKVEILLIREDGDSWWAMSKPGLGQGKMVLQRRTSPRLVKFKELSGEIIEIRDGLVRIKFDKTGEEFKKIILEIGKTPLPPYINSSLNEEEAREKYQTVYAKYEGSVAAPTAGFHFSDSLLDSLKEKGVKICYVTLHVGLGTFQGVKAENIEDHQMHSEWFELTAETAKKLNQYKQEGRRIISVGTTSTRVLESCANDFGLLEPATGETKIFIYPPYKFRFVDALITNFHLPKSTLLMLVSAFVSSPNTEDEFINFKSSLVGEAYQKAIDLDFHFYSFGDAMFIC